MTNITDEKIISDFIDSIKVSYNFNTQIYSHPCIKNICLSILDALESKPTIELKINNENSQQVLYDAISDNRFISDDIIEQIKSKEMNFFEYEINKIHKIYLFLLDKNDNSDPDINKIALIINFMNNLAQKYNNPINPVNLTVIYSDIKKHIYPKTEILTKQNINSASAIPEKSIIIWRKEEFYKVLIHELCHHYRFDFSVHDKNYNLLEHTLIIPKIDGYDAINESYTESLTVIILIILRYITNKQIDKSDLNNFNSYFVTELKNEIKFLSFQIAKIIYILNGNNFSDLHNQKIIIKQSTSFRSYFILKLTLLQNINKLFKFMDRSLRINDSRIIDYGELLNKSYNHENNIIDKFIKYIKDNYNENEFIYTTCRMTANAIF